MRGHDGREHGHRVGVDRAAGAVDERHEHPPREDLPQSGAVALRDEKPRRVRTDVDARATQALPSSLPVSSAAPAILVRDLRKRYGDHHAVRGLDFEVAPGEVFGLLGPNGAGKTTTVEILEGYRTRTSGIVSVLGHDPQQRSHELRERMGIVLQSTGMYRHIAVREAIAHWARFYPRPRDVDEVVDLAGLREKADAYTRTLCGGQLRRLDFALALVGDPELIFLDEPTTGFDPAARRAAWDVVRSLQDLGKTVLLTTHYLDEAQALCDRVAIVKEGRFVAEGPPASLGAGSTRYRVTWRDEDGALQTRESDDPTALLHQLTSAALARGDGAARPLRHPPDARGRLPRADGRGRRGRRRDGRRGRGGDRQWLRPRPSPGASTGSSAGCSGATRRRRSSTSSCRCCSSRCSARSSAATRRTST